MDIGDIVSNSVKYPSSDWTKVIILIKLKEEEKIILLVLI